MKLCLCNDRFGASCYQKRHDVSVQLEIKGYINSVLQKYMPIKQSLILEKVSMVLNAKWLVLHIVICIYL